mmetsp:Transcript_23093/g.58888  ORF Transcript_23093/g.58888 Transcript_23093/m.58888 type:complete len:569 (+) Transcript_23093:146-1852(+)|eukprot:CAMPEP_0115841404 /NCGR_PEP_ID=MMETSP0287-20121206/7270_1 /TAXON_ID=412157 /ORGANISM="Chrysochromulina rotalis, Strain UIO044" /LENGTH=568 /DNA_ID=CAMNT_0003295047 /DNA_START=97 /DNA_END=1803 /DNA_ORIENTATION=+
MSGISGAMRLIIGLVMLAVPIWAQMPGGMSMMGGDEDTVETHYAEELDDETFSDRLAEYELLLVLFRTKSYQDQQLVKEVELAAAELSDEAEAIYIGKVDLDNPNAKKAAKIADVSQGPVFKCFRRGKALGLGPAGGDARTLVNFMRYLSAPVSRWLANSTSVNEWLRAHDQTTVLGIFSDAKRPSHNTWVQNAEKLRPPFRFAETSWEAAQASKAFSGITLDKTKNQYAVVLPGRWLAKDEAPVHISSDFRTMSAFLEEHALPRIGPLWSFAQKKHREAGLKVVSLFFHQEKMTKMFKYLVNRMHKLLAAEPSLTETFAFTVMDLQQAGPTIATEFGVTPTDFAVTVTDVVNGQTWGTDVLTNMTADSFSALPLGSTLHQIANGELPPYIKSEVPPEVPAAEGQVQTVVGTTFDELANDEAVDVLLEMYSEQKATAMDEVAALFTKVPSVRAMRMNFTANKYNFSRFTMREKTEVFFLAASAGGKRLPVRHMEKGEPKATDLAKFVLKHMSSPEEPDVLAGIQKMVKERIKAEKAQNPFDGLGGEDAPKKKKKRRKKNGKKGAKEEL